jgi:hypothetical protein
MFVATATSRVGPTYAGMERLKLAGVRHRPRHLLRIWEHSALI